MAKCIEKHIQNSSFWNLEWGLSLQDCKRHQSVEKAAFQIWPTWTCACKWISSDSLIKWIYMYMYMTVLSGLTAGFDSVDVLQWADYPPLMFDGLMTSKEAYFAVQGPQSNTPLRYNYHCQLQSSWNAISHDCPRGYPHLLNAWRQSSHRPSLGPWSPA